MVAHTCNPSTWLLRQEDYKFVASLCYVEKVYIKTTTKKTFSKDEDPLKFLIKHIMVL